MLSIFGSVGYLSYMGQMGHLVHMGHMGHFMYIAISGSRGSCVQQVFSAILCHAGLKHTASHNLVTYWSRLGAWQVGFTPGSELGHILNGSSASVVDDPGDYYRLGDPQTFSNNFMRPKIESVHTHSLCYIYPYYNLRSSCYISRRSQLLLEKR